jgi:hypothetical protein
MINLKDVIPLRNYDFTNTIHHEGGTSTVELNNNIKITFERTTGNISYIFIDVLPMSLVWTNASIKKEHKDFYHLETQSILEVLKNYDGNKYFPYTGEVITTFELDDDIIDDLKSLAEQNNISIEEQLKTIIINNITLRPYDGNGDIMTWDEFAQCVEAGGFIDYDGYAHPLTDEGNVMSMSIYPSEINQFKNKKIKRVVWYNR